MAPTTSKLRALLPIPVCEKLRARHLPIFRQTVRVAAADRVPISWDTLAPAFEGASEGLARGLREATPLILVAVFLRPVDDFLGRIERMRARLRRQADSLGKRR